MLQLKEIIRILILLKILNNLLLEFPSFYKSKVFYFESAIKKDNGFNELLLQLSLVHNIKGNIIECGSARCGTSVILADYLYSKINK